MRFYHFKAHIWYDKTIQVLLAFIILSVCVLYCIFCGTNNDSYDTYYTDNSNIKNIVLRSFSKSGIAYIVRSNAITRLSNDKYYLSDMNIHYSLNGKNFIAFITPTTVVDHNNQSLTFSSASIKFHDAQFDFRILDVDLVSGRVNSKQPVTFEYKNIIVKANEFNMNAEKVMHFDKNVHVNIQIKN